MTNKLLRRSKMRAEAKQKQGGFTLVELAIVLIIVGLILGMVFKGRQLIDSAKVKAEIAKYNKILAGVNTFLDRYGFYPGDGCTSATPQTPSACNGYKNGLITTNNERAAFWYLLIDVTHILSKADRKSVFGQNWNIWYGSPGGRFGDWLDFPGGNQLPAKFICAIDQKIDDGDPNKGDIRSSGTYDASTDCWSLNTQIDAWFYVLP